jgi:spore maturation protein CgeB
LGPQETLPQKAPKTVISRPVNLKIDQDRYPLQGRPHTNHPVPQLAAAPKILFLDTGYFISKELQRAAKKLQIPISVWRSQTGETAVEADYQRLLEQIKTFRPSLILTVNHLGFDSEGILAQALESLGLCVASWFVDSPAYILGPAKKANQDGLFLFSWDRDYLAPLQEMGFKKVHYLPLATDNELFCPQKANKQKQQIAFVGDSLSSSTLKYLNLVGLGEDILPAIDQLAEEFLKNNELTAASLIEELSDQHKLSAEQKVNLAALVTWRGSRLWRHKVLSALPPKNLTVAGDPAWKQLLPKIKVTGKREYYTTLAPFYRSTAVNINITSAQMKNGLNQRIFDVPSCGAFLLTDYRAQLTGMFEIDSEIITYHTPQDAAEKAQWWLRHPIKREKVALKAQERIVREHLYQHRLSKLLKIVQCS